MSLLSPRRPLPLWTTPKRGHMEEEEFPSDGGEEGPPEESAEQATIQEPASVAAWNSSLCPRCH
eukprot:1180769-Pyramimonas_sp.AAC.1